MTTFAVTSVSSLLCQVSTCLRIGSKFRYLRSTPTEMQSMRERLRVLREHGGEGTSDNVSELTDRPQQNCHQKCGERKNHTKCPLSTRSVESAFGVRAAELG